MNAAAAGISAVAALDDPIRRRLYDLVAASVDGLSRDAAAHAAGVARHVAAYHLDRLADAGLLTVAHRRESGRTGPGAGRPARIYRRAAGAVDVSIPPRNYRLASQLLLQALPPSGSADLTDASARRGEEMGSAARGRRLADVLTGLGFDPQRTRGGEIRLRNCPFHELADSDRETVCGMNLALLRGVAKGMELRDLGAVPDTAPGGCCVMFRRSTAAPGAR